MFVSITKNFSFVMLFAIAALYSPKGNKGFSFSW